MCFVFTLIGVDPILPLSQQSVTHPRIISPGRPYPPFRKPFQLHAEVVRIEFSSSFHSISSSTSAPSKCTSDTDPISTMCAEVKVSSAFPVSSLTFRISSAASSPTYGTGPPHLAGPLHSENAIGLACLRQFVLYRNYGFPTRDIEYGRMESISLMDGHKPVVLDCSSGGLRDLEDIWFPLPSRSANG